MKRSQIKTWKAFYNYLCPKDRQNNFHKKVYRRAFSIIARNRWVCEKLEDKSGVLVKHNVNGFHLQFKMSKLTPNARWTKIPTSLNFTYLESVGGLKIQQHNLNNIKIQAIELSDGTVKMVNFANLQSLLYSGENNVKEIFSSRSSLRESYISKHPEKFLSIEKYFKNGTYVMVLEDCLWFKRGQIIKKHLTYSESEWRSNKSPNEVLSDYFSLTTTIECNLNLDLDLPKPTSCQKQKFGCSRGCLNYCFSDSDNRAKMELYNIMKKYKDML